MKFMTYVTSFA